jgi:hypothetical protein
MISVHLRSDIKPHCDRHPSRYMIFVFLQLEPGIDKPWQPAYICTEHNCPRHYNPNYGYFNIFKQRVDPDTLRRVPCPNDALPMFVESVDIGHQMWTWRCSEFACDGSSLQAATQSRSAKA